MGTLAFISKFLVVVRIRMELEVGSQFFFAQISLFCCSWFRLQSIAMHCNRLVCRQIQLTRNFFSTLSSLCTHHIVAHDVSAQNMFNHMSESLLFPCFVFFLCLSCLHFLSHFYLFSGLNFNLHVVENAEHQTQCAPAQ